METLDEKILKSRHEEPFSSEDRSSSPNEFITTQINTNLDLSGTSNLINLDTISVDDASRTKSLYFPSQETVESSSQSLVKSSEFNSNPDQQLNRRSNPKPIRDNPPARKVSTTPFMVEMGRLSTQYQPESSNARTATLFPAPD
jgi:hypothetical protein